jgi:hypothetical protein
MANGLCVGPSEAETFWTDFLRSLKSRGLRGVKLVISDAHNGLKAAIARVFEATWQRLPRSLDQERARPCAQGPAYRRRRRDPPGVQPAR